MLNYILFPEQDHKILFFFLSMEDTNEHRRNEPIFHRSLSYAMLYEDTDLYQNECLCSFGNKFLEDVPLLEAGP